MQVEINIPITEEQLEKESKEAIEKFKRQGLWPVEESEEEICETTCTQKKCDTCYHDETEFSICQFCKGGDKYEKRYG